MVERLVDVVSPKKGVVHTFPVSVPDGESAPPDAAFEAKALDAAKFAELVPKPDVEELSARMHVSRGGQVVPYGDPKDFRTETKAALDEAVRERAYHLWEAAGRPEGQGDAIWQQAREQHLRERAYKLWEMEGCPEGQCDDHWHRTCNYVAA
jgi:hypothetical protein